MSMKIIEKKPKKSRSKTTVVKTQAETTEHKADEIVNGLWLGNRASATTEFIASKILKDFARPQHNSRSALSCSHCSVWWRKNRMSQDSSSF
jgi:hypothetical protein